MSTQPRTSNRWRRPSSWVAIAGLVVAGGLLGALTVALADSDPSSVAQRSSTGATLAATCPATRVAEQTLPSVVTIAARRGTAGGTGSGEVIRSNGYILTNNHVISVAANGGSVEVLFSDGVSAAATITGRDPKVDLAVIKVSVEKPLPVIPFGSSTDVVVGQPVLALGAPLGLSGTVTSGIISALDRTIDLPGDNGQLALLIAALQTDAAINPGNSGGALVDCSGKLVGVPTAGATAPNESGQASSGSIGLGFAIPVDFAKMVSDEIIATGSVTHASFGLQVAATPPANPSGASAGLYVAGVVPGGPAANAGLMAGDIITEIDGKPATAVQLAALTLTKRAGDTVMITYERNGQVTTATVTLGAQP